MCIHIFLLSAATPAPAGYGSTYNRPAPPNYQMHGANYPQHASPHQGQMQQHMYGNQSHPGTPRPQGVIPSRTPTPAAGRV